MQPGFIGYRVMFLSENLKKNNILLKPKSRTRWELIEEMVELAEKNKEVPEDDIETLKKSLLEREKAMSTGIGNGVAIPHCTTTRINDIVIIMALNQKGIDFDAIDNQPVRIVILLLVPKNKLTQHIKNLANIAKMMSDETLREKLMQSKTGDGIVKTLKGYKLKN